MNLEFDEIEAFIQFFLAEKQWRHSLLFKFGVSWFWESILSGQYSTAKPSSKEKAERFEIGACLNPFELFDVSYYKSVQLSLTWIFGCSIVLENLCNLKLIQQIYAI